MLHSSFQLHIMYAILFKEECASPVNSSGTAHLNLNSSNMCTHAQMLDQTHSGRRGKKPFRNSTNARGPTFKHKLVRCTFDSWKVQQRCMKTCFYEHRFPQTPLFVQLPAELTRVCECLSLEPCEQEQRDSRRVMRCEDFDKDAPINGARGRQRKLTIGFNRSSVPPPHPTNSANSWK